MQNILYLLLAKGVFRRDESFGSSSECVLITEAIDGWLFINNGMMGDLSCYAQSFN